MNYSAIFGHLIKSVFFTFSPAPRPSVSPPSSFDDVNSFAPVGRVALGGRAEESWNGVDWPVKLLFRCFCLIKARKKKYKHWPNFVMRKGLMHLTTPMSLQANELVGTRPSLT